MSPLLFGELSKNHLLWIFVQKLSKMSRGVGGLHMICLNFSTDSEFMQKRWLLGDNATSQRRENAKLFILDWRGPWLADRFYRAVIGWSEARARNLEAHWPRHRKRNGQEIREFRKNYQCYANINKLFKII